MRRVAHVLIADMGTLIEELMGKYPVSEEQSKDLIESVLHTRVSVIHANGVRDIHGVYEFNLTTGDLLPDIVNVINVEGMDINQLLDLVKYVDHQVNDGHLSSYWEVVINSENTLERVTIKWKNTDLYFMLE